MSIIAFYLEISIILILSLILDLSCLLSKPLLTPFLLLRSSPASHRDLGSMGHEVAGPMTFVHVGDLHILDLEERLRSK